MKLKDYIKAAPEGAVIDLDDPEIQYPAIPQRRPWLSLSMKPTPQEQRLLDARPLKITPPPKEVAEWIGDYKTNRDMILGFIGSHARSLRSIYTDAKVRAELGYRTTPVQAQKDFFWAVILLCEQKLSLL